MEEAVCRWWGLDGVCERIEPNVSNIASVCGASLSPATDVLTCDHCEKICFLIFGSVLQQDFGAEDPSRLPKRHRVLVLLPGRSIRITRVLQPPASQEKNF